MRCHASTRKCESSSPYQRFASSLAVATLVLMIAFVTQAAEPEPGQHPSLSESDQAKLARYLWDGMAESRKKLERGSFVATGRRVIDDLTIRSHGEGEVKLVGAFDFENGLTRFDRSEPLAVPAPAPAELAKDMAAKLIMTPQRTISWLKPEGQGNVVLIAEPRSAQLIQHVAPFDIRGLGLLFWNRDSSVLEFEHVLKTWTDAHLEEVAKESDHIYRIAVSSGQNNAILQTLWVDDSRGFGPTRCEVASRSGLPIYVTEMVWVQIHGTWVPKKYRNEVNLGSLSDIYDLSFKWDLVNKPVPQTLFTVAGLELAKGTPVVDTLVGK